MKKIRILAVDDQEFNLDLIVFAFSFEAYTDYYRYGK